MERGMLSDIPSYVSSCLNQETICLASLRFCSSISFSFELPPPVLANFIQFSFLAEYFTTLLVLIHSTITIGSAGTDSYSAAILVNISQPAVVEDRGLICSIFWFPYWKSCDHGWFQAINTMSRNTKWRTLHTIGSWMCVWASSSTLLESFH